MQAVAGAGEERWVEGDDRVVLYRDRIGIGYQAVIGEEEGERDEKEDRAVLLSACDLWSETRLGEPTAGGIWDEVHARRQQRGAGLDLARGNDTDPGARRDDGGEKAGEVTGGYSEDWLNE